MPSKLRVFFRLSLEDAFILGGHSVLRFIQRKWK